MFWELPLFLGCRLDKQTWFGFKRELRWRIKPENQLILNASFVTAEDSHETLPVVLVQLENSVRYDVTMKGFWFLRKFLGTPASAVSGALSRSRSLVRNCAMSLVRNCATSLGSCNHRGWVGGSRKECMGYVVELQIVCSQSWQSGFGF